MIGIPIDFVLKLTNPGMHMLKSIVNLFLLYHLL